MKIKDIGISSFCICIYWWECNEQHLRVTSNTWGLLKNVSRLLEQPPARYGLTHAPWNWLSCQRFCRLKIDVLTRWQIDRLPKCLQKSTNVILDQIRTQEMHPANERSQLLLHFQERSLTGHNCSGGSDPVTWSGHNSCTHSLLVCDVTCDVVFTVLLRKFYCLNTRYNRELIVFARSHTTIW